MPLRTRRWNDAPEPDDGYRVLVCRHRPRGVRKADEPWNAWWPELAPSAELVASFKGKRGEPPSWESYLARYLDEMRRRRFWIEALAARVREGETVTLLCTSTCVDAARCHRTPLAALVEGAVAPPPAAAPGRAVVRRRVP